MGFVDRKLLSEALVPLFLEASESIQSGNDHSTVLIALINSGQLSTSHLERVINSAASIHQDYDLSRVLTTLANAYSLKANARAAYIKVAQQIHSEYERNRALAAVSSVISFLSASSTPATSVNSKRRVALTAAATAPACHESHKHRCRQYCKGLVIRRSGGSSVKSSYAVGIPRRKAPRNDKTREAFY